MFKVHFPATSYFNSLPKVHGSDVFLKALIVSRQIKKSALLHYRVGGENNQGFVHTWAPEEAINPDPNEPDHPPWSHNPQTGKLIFNPDGTPFGHHPIDYVNKDLSEKYGPERARQMIDGAIERYNKKHAEDSNHLLPGFDSPEWRKVFAGDYIDRDTHASERQVRGDTPLYEGGPTPLNTYSMNMGNVDPRTGSDQGAWIDGGHVHFHKELGEEMESMGIPRSEYAKLPYVRYSVLKPNYLTNDLVVSWNKTDAAKAGVSGSSPDNYLHPVVRDRLNSQRTHPEVHAHQIAHLLPDVFYHGATGSGGGRKKGGEEDPVTAGENLARIMEEAGVSTEGYSPEELNQIAGTMAMKLFFSRTHNLQGSGGGAVKNTINDAFRELGSHHSDETYGDYRTHAKAGVPTGGPRYHKTANMRSADIVAHLNNLAHKYVQDGMSEEEALQQAAAKFRSHDTKRARYAPVEGLRERTEDLIGRIMGQQGHEKLNLGTSLPQGRIEAGLPQGFGEQMTEVPDHWRKRIVGTSDLAPVGNKERDIPLPTEPEAQPEPQAPPPSRQTQLPVRVIPTPMTPRPATPQEAAFQQSVGNPATQQFFDPMTGGLVQRSQDVVSAIDAIRKKMGYFEGFLKGYRNE